MSKYTQTGGQARFTVELPGDVIATLSRLSDGRGYSVPGESVEFGIWTTERDFCLPSQIGLPMEFDRFWDGDKEYGGVAPYVPTKDAVAIEQAFMALERRRDGFEVGDRVFYKGNSRIMGEVVAVERSSHPAFSDSVTVKLDEGLTMLVMSEERNVVEFYAAALEVL